MQVQNLVYARHALNFDENFKRYKEKMDLRANQNNWRAEC